MKRKRLSGFTLAEVLITLAIIGVVAALSIPAVISNSQQQEFKTGLRKAVSVLNSAITMNMALDGESPYDNKDLPRYLMKHMNILKTTSVVPYNSYTNYATGMAHGGNGAFYTADGMRFEFNAAISLYEGRNKLHESNQYACTALSTLRGNGSSGNTGSCNDGGVVYECGSCQGCGSYGLKSTDLTGKPPCLILVDVNGDKKPTPGNINCKDSTCGKKDNLYKVPLPSEKKVRDIFSILITEEKAIPYGVTAQKAMYQARK